MTRTIVKAFTATAVFATTAVLAGGLLAPSVAAAADQNGRCEDGVAIRTGPRTGDGLLGRCYPSHRVTLHELVPGEHMWCEPGPGRPTNVTYWWRMTDRTTGVSGYATLCYVHGA